MGRRHAVLLHVCNLRLRQFRVLWDLGWDDDGAADVTPHDDAILELAVNLTVHDNPKESMVLSKAFKHVKISSSWMTDNGTFDIYLRSFVLAVLGRYRALVREEKSWGTAPHLRH